MKHLAAIVLVSAGQAHADAPPPTVAPETIEVTDLRVPRLPAEGPASVTVVERADLERTSALTIDDAIRSVPSVAMFRRSSSLVADPTSQGVNLRGLGPSGVSRALVLRDGIPLNDPFGGWVYWRAIPIGSIERIEIQPSGASLFGNFGLGGAIGISSRPIPDATQIEASIAGGSYATLRSSVRGAGRIAGVGVELDGEHLRSSGFVPIALHDRGAVDGRASTEHVVGGVRLERIAGTSQLRGYGRVFDEHLDAGTLFTTADVRTATYGASWRLTRADWRLDVAAFGGNQRFDQQRARVTPDRSAAEPASAQRTPSNNQGASAMWTTRLARHTLQLGVDAVRVAGTATDVLTPAMTSETTVVQRAAGGEQRFLGVFVQDTLEVSETTEIAAAVRVDGWQQRDGRRRLLRANGETMLVPFDDRGDLQVSPRLGALHEVSDQLAIRGSIYRAFRAPTLNELYRPFQVGTVMTAANAALEPEVLWGGELGPQVVVGTLVARATGFYNRVTDPIFNATLDTPAADGAMRMRQNLGRARVAGLELEASWRPAEAWTATVGYTFMHAKVVDAPVHPDLVGAWLAQDPRQRASGTLTFDDPAIATLSAEARFTSRQFEDDLNTLPMDAYVLFDVFASRRLGRGFSWFASATNVLDRRYLVGRAGVDTIGQPRTLLTGVAFTVGRE
ncbi:MAG: TonB-dependent receptor [Myxococcales bacterium]|nr:TonB-dependent receptor [Myxococcales bacterium]